MFEPVGIARIDGYSSVVPGLEAVKTFVHRDPWCPVEQCAGHALVVPMRCTELLGKEASHRWILGDASTCPNYFDRGPPSLC